MARSHSTPTQHPRKPDLTNAYLVGGGIASLASAVHLVHDAHVPPSQIHILGSGPDRLMHVTTRTPETGYFLWAEQLLNASCVCLYDLLSIVPSLTDPAKTVKQEIVEFNTGPGNRTYANSRLIARDADGPRIANSSDLGLSGKDRRELANIFRESEKKFNDLRVSDCFEEAFFKTNFWLMWATMFSFQPWHSAIEFRRYLHRFIFALPKMHTLEGLHRTPYNHYDSIILPIETYLKSQGVKFDDDIEVTRLSFAKGSEINVEEIHFSKNDNLGTIHVEDSDIVFLTLGSTTACTTIGDNHSPPTPLPSIHDAGKDFSWRLWSSLFFSELLGTTHISQLGNPKSFYSRMTQSTSLWFTVTLKSPRFFELFEDLTSNKPGRGGLTTFKDSSWLMSIVVPHQPYFPNQPDGVHVFWGYALSPDKSGDLIQKPMVECTGQEIFQELLGHLSFPEDSTWNNATIIPYVIPHATSPLLTRTCDDRPHVIPKGSKNLALLGQFVDVPLDGVFILEYSVRTAQTAVFNMMGMQKKPKEMDNGDKSFMALTKTLKAILS